MLSTFFHLPSGATDPILAGFQASGRRTGSDTRPASCPCAHCVRQGDGRFGWEGPRRTGRRRADRRRHHDSRSHVHSRRAGGGQGTRRVLARGSWVRALQAGLPGARVDSTERTLEGPLLSRRARPAARPRVSPFATSQASTREPETRADHGTISAAGRTRVRSRRPPTVLPAMTGTPARPPTHAPAGPARGGHSPPPRWTRVFA